jgi:hypothetical protein
MGTSRFVVRKLDQTDPDAVLTWAEAACRTFPLEELLTASERDSGVEPTLDAVIASLRRTFPPETRDAAERGCRTGFARRSKS